MYYAGIGSRETPDVILSQMEFLAMKLAVRGITLRSGGARGADTAFQNGCTRVGGSMELWLPKPPFNSPTEDFKLPTDYHFDIVSQHHPRWASLKEFIQRLHARNVGQILGTDGQDPSKFVICWTPDGCIDQASRSYVTGGTGTAISIACEYNIPIFNLQRPNELNRLAGFLKEFFENTSYNLGYPAVSNQWYEPNARYTIPEDVVFVFGSNLAGRHGKGAAHYAKHNKGATKEVVEGLSGSSYAIPTKDENLDTLGLDAIQKSVERFVDYTKTSGRKFLITPIGTGLAGYRHLDIAPMFRGVENAWIPVQWRPYFD